MIITQSVSKADLLRVSLALSSRLRARAKGWSAILIFVLFGGSLCRAQGTYTAASCNQSDVNAVINGPTHTAINGDKIIIPAGSCTWITGVVISGVGIDITGTGTPNTGPGTRGAGTALTTLIDGGSGPLFKFTRLSTSSSLATVELLNIGTTITNSSLTPSPVAFVGVCTATPPYCPNARADNLNFAAGEWQAALDGGLTSIDGVFGVADHNSGSESATGPPVFLTQVNYSSWQGVGTNGDNSYASPDTFGTAQSWYMENNNLAGIRFTDNDVSPSGRAGGARYVIRFNTITNMQADGIGGAHGTAWGGRFRGQRQVETYYNTVSGSSCDALNGLNSGTGYFFSNTITGTGCNKMTQLDIARLDGSPAPVAPWSQCNGSSTMDPTPWSTSSFCLDQPGSGAGVLYAIFGGNPSQVALASNPTVQCTTAGQCPSGAVLDPVYEAGEVSPNNAPGLFVLTNGSQLRVLANRDYYAQVSDVAQTSPTSPFNGSTGTGYGTLANRPPCTSGCITGAGYWATDTGTWNTHNSQQGTLYVWNGSFWAVNYTPYTYPHPLSGGGSTTSGGPNPPTGLTVTVE